MAWSAGATLMTLPCLAIASFTAGSAKAVTTAACTRLTSAGGMPFGPSTREPGLDHVAGQALLDEGGDLRRRRHALRGGHADGAQRAALQVRLHARQRSGGEVDLAADQVGEHRAHALVRDVARLDAGLVEEHRRRPGAGWCRCRPRRRSISPFLAFSSAMNSLALLGRHLGVDHQHDRRVADHGDRREVARHVEGQRLVDAREDDHVVRHHAEREAVGRRTRQRLQADDAAGAGLVVDDDRVAQRLGQRRLRGARDRVDARAGGVGQDEADALVAPARRRAAPRRPARPASSVRGG